MWGHVFDDLAAYAEGQLEPARAGAVDAHLTRCPRCRASLERIRTGIALAGELSPAPMPEEVAARIRARLDAADRGAAVTRLDWRWQAAAAMVALAIGVAVYWQLNRPWLDVQAAVDPPTRFETAGRQLHDRAAIESPPMMLASTDEAAVWHWLAAQGAPVSGLVPERSAAERRRVQVQGASVATLAGARASVLTYRVDDRPVTLVLASSHEVSDAPAAGWWSKRVRHRRHADGTTTLTWTAGGDTYVMTSSLPAPGLGACVICHTTPPFTSRFLALTVR